jgi:hypothetical protein
MYEFLFFWFIISITCTFWVYTDASSRGLNAKGWALATIFFGIIFLVIYLLFPKSGYVKKDSLEARQSERYYKIGQQDAIRERDKSRDELIKIIDDFRSGNYIIPDKIPPIYKESYFNGYKNKLLDYIDLK